jgi:hypothetical protein
MNVPRARDTWIAGDLRSVSVSQKTKLKIKILPVPYDEKTR